MIVGIFGQKENGKSTLANILIDLLTEKKLTKYEWSVVGFAHPLKMYLADITRMKMLDLANYKTSDVKPPGWNVTARQGMQMLGECIRQIKPDAWIEYITEYPIVPHTLIVEDGRYLNEAKAIKEKGGYNILIIRPDKFDRTAIHPSESEMIETIEHCITYNSMKVADTFDKVIFNTRGLTELKTMAEVQIMNGLHKHIKNVEPDLLSKAFS